MMRARSAPSDASPVGASAKAPVERSSQARPNLAAGFGDAGEVIVPARVEQAVLGQGAGRDDPHDGALDRPLVAAAARLGRVLDLLADRDLEAGADQLREIAVGGMHRHAAHRDVGAVVLAALGQRDVERRRRRHRVVEEQLVEIPHAKEQQAHRDGPP